MKHVFIINPAAGKRDRTAAVTAEVTRCCARMDYEIAVSIAGEMICERALRREKDGPRHHGCPMH